LTHKLRINSMGIKYSSITLLIETVSYYNKC
jgi:hypothetical protein